MLYLVINFFITGNAPVGFYSRRHYLNQPMSPPYPFQYFPLFLQSFFRQLTRPRVIPKPQVFRPPNQSASPPIKLPIQLPKPVFKPSKPVVKPGVQPRLLGALGDLVGGLLGGGLLL